VFGALAVKLDGAISEIILNPKEIYSYALLHLNAMAKAI